MCPSETTDILSFRTHVRNQSRSYIPGARVELPVEIENFWVVVAATVTALVTLAVESTVLSVCFAVHMWVVVLLKGTNREKRCTITSFIFTASVSSRRWYRLLTSFPSPYPEPSPVDDGFSLSFRVKMTDKVMATVIVIVAATSPIIAIILCFIRWCYLFCCCGTQLHKYLECRRHANEASRANEESDRLLTSLQDRAVLALSFPLY